MLGSALPLASFAATCLVIEATPGPNMGYLAFLSATSGRKAGFLAVLGIMLGLLLMGVAYVAGLSVVISESPLVYQSLRWAGVAYMVWLAWTTWRDAEPAELLNHPTAYQHFRHGLITNLLNPKAAAFYLSVLPEFVDITQPHLYRQTWILTFVYVFIATSVHAFIVLAAGRISVWLKEEKQRRMAQRIFAVLLLFIAGCMAF